MDCRLFRHLTAYNSNFLQVIQIYFYWQKMSGKNSSFKFSQIFGHKAGNQKIQEEDIITRIKFDDTGKFLALGDKAGRIILFENAENGKKDCQFDYYSEFQSHSRELDYLNTNQIEEDIIDVNWLRPQGKYQKMITTNSKVIKVWKMHEKAQKKIAKSAGKDLNMPKLQVTDSEFAACPQKIFPSKHIGQINSVSVTNSEEYLFSTDNFNAFMWSFEKMNQPYIIADILKEEKMEEAKEHITTSKVHPRQDNLFAMATNFGNMKLVDLRISSSFDSNSTNFKFEQSGNKNFFTDMISSVSSLQFNKGGKYIVSKDYLNVHIWDVNNLKKPVSVIPVMENLKPKLCEVFENDSIFDKFQVATSNDSNTIFTGAYNNSFNLIDANESTVYQYDLNYKKNTICKNVTGKRPQLPAKMDYMKKVLAGDFNLKRNLLAVASLNCFFIYAA